MMHIDQHKFHFYLPSGWSTLIRYKLKKVYGVDFSVYLNEFLNTYENSDAAHRSKLDVELLKIMEASSHIKMFGKIKHVWDMPTKYFMFNYASACKVVDISHVIYMSVLISPFFWRDIIWNNREIKFDVVQSPTASRYPNCGVWGGRYTPSSISEMKECPRYFKMLTRLLKIVQPALHLDAKDRILLDKYRQSEHEYEIYTNSVGEKSIYFGEFELEILSYLGIGLYFEGIACGGEYRYSIACSLVTSASSPYRTVEIPTDLIECAMCGVKKASFEHSVKDIIKGEVKPYCSDYCKTRNEKAEQEFNDEVPF